jgi:hypothetical protein
VSVKKTEPAAPPAAAGNGRKAEDPSDFASAFAGALVSAVRDQRVAAGDDRIAAALGLGWYLAAIAHPGEITRTSAAARGDLRGAVAVTDVQMIAFCCSQLKVAFARLGDIVEKAGLELPALGDLESAEPDARREVAAKLDVQALSVLSAAEFGLGKAYSLGRALMNLTTRASREVTLKHQWSDSAVASVLAAVDDLSSLLRPHAGQSVRGSILEWQASIREGSRVVPERGAAWLQLARQGELWRTLLTGEKDGRDMLMIEDYVDAAGRLSKRMRAVAWRVVKEFHWLLAAAAVLFVIGAALIVVTDSSAAIVAGAGTILASFGLTWRGLGRSFGALAAKLEQPLWGAEVDVAIKQAITLLEREEGRDTAGERRATAVALGELDG